MNRPRVAHHFSIVYDPKSHANETESVSLFRSFTKDTTIDEVGNFDYLLVILTI